MNRKIIITALILVNGLTGLNLHANSGIESLKNLSYQDNPVLKSIRDDIRLSIFTVKGNRNEKNLPELKFYTYKVKANENFWTVLAKCSLDMDTLMSVNGLTSPYQVVPGYLLYIPNMRGIIVPGDDKQVINRIMASERIGIKYIQNVNKSDTLAKKYIFIPCGRISAIERSLFMGTAYLSPIREGRLSSGFGTRKDPFNEQRMQFHKGIDLACPVGSKVHASRAGRVIFNGYMEGYGKLVILQHEFGYQSYYGHLSKCKVKNGDLVKPGQVIALTGNTGRSTGPHLHFEIRKNGRSMNPGMLLSKNS